ncbi:MAG TPA: toll/interleukin-1 receptor domain-containing protein [Solirubrobacteraceae bacterium]|jgi:hypothetical protein|nr:toll/interleukin-1 receptor domain-containing protein [Solirubrobacteraceae bacterium]
MAGLFLSHSSTDKPFVTKLAIDLVNRGMPVWFDTWEMDTGDSLQARIYDGIGDSDLIVVVLSASSVGSSWVRKELTAALTLEDRRGKTLVVPIRISDCEIPLAIADRLYADFSSAYLDPLEQLVGRLKQLGVDGLNEPPDHALIPLVFEHGIYLDSVQLERRLASLRPRLPAGFTVGDEQFVIKPDENYSELRRRMVERAEGIEDDPYFSPDFSRTFKQLYNAVLDYEKHLVEGIRLIVNGGLSHSVGVYDVGLACHWYARLIRSELLHVLWSSQNPDRSDVIDFGKSCDPAPLGDSTSAARFFEVEDGAYVDIGPRGPDIPGLLVQFANSVLVFVDGATGRSVGDALVSSVNSLGYSELYPKYLLPQLVRRYVADPASPITFTFEDWYVGLH